MKHATFAAAIGVLLLTSVSHANIIDLLDHPESVPMGKPLQVQVQTSVTVDNLMQSALITLDAIEFDTATKQVRYYQLTPVTINFAGGDSIDISDLSSILDPTGSFAASYTDFGAPSTFSTTFSFPAFVPTMYGNVLFSGSVSGSVTDGTLVPNGVSYAPSPIANPGVFKYDLLDTTSAIVATFWHDPGSAFGAGPPNTHTTGPYDNSGSPLLVAAGPNGVGTVVVTSSFLGSGGTDRYAFTGRWDVVVPEPSSFMLCGLGLLGLVGIRRRTK